MAQPAHGCCSQCFRPVHFGSQGVRPANDSSRPHCSAGILMLSYQVLKEDLDRPASDMQSKAETNIAQIHYIKTELGAGRGRNTRKLMYYRVPKRCVTVAPRDLSKVPAAAGAPRKSMIAARNMCSASKLLFKTYATGKFHRTSCLLSSYACL